MVRYEKGTDVYTYTYNGDGQRLSKTVNGVTTEFTWDGMDMILESSGSAASIYVYGNGINYRKTGNSVYTYTTNAHGDVVNYTQGSTVVKEYCYDAFGNELDEYDWRDSENPLRYCGEYYDAETGLYYLRNRYYDPKAGRFITEDPIRDGNNWYVYCNGNPVMFFDPTGTVLQLEGTGEEVSQIWGYLNELTDDALVLTQLEENGMLVDKYIVSIGEQNDWGHDVGTNMIRRIVGNYLTCYVSVDNTQGSHQNAIDYTSATNGKGTGSTIGLNLKDSVSVLTQDNNGKTQYENIPKYIELGHELIHALRAMGGNTKHYNNQGTYAYTTPDGKTQTFTWKQEEFETTGISYYPGYKYAGTPVNAWLWYTTENALRDEHGLNRRVRY